MKNELASLTLFFIIIIFASCSPKVNQGLVAANQTDSESGEWKPRGPLYFVAPVGIYKGAVPCDDCPGIEVTLDFKENNSVVKSERYIQSKTKKTSKHTGSWVVIEDNIVRVTFPNKNLQEFYKAQNGGHLIMLNSEKELKIAPSQAQFFIFNPD